MNISGSILQKNLTQQKLTLFFESGRDIQHLIEFTREYQDLGVRQPFWQQLNKIVKIHSIQSLLNNLTLNIPDTHIEIFRRSDAGKGNL